jgi:CPA2 family monovalent cation:H+ antiporter-2
MEFSQQLFFVILAALIGGLSVRVFKLQPIIGYTLAGIIFGSIFLGRVGKIEMLAEIGTILLLFSIGVELSWVRLSRVLRVAVFGGILQIIAVTILGYLALQLLGFEPPTALILSAGFSLSSTALVVKILFDRGEADTIHGEVLIGWLLVQDLATVPILVILGTLGKGNAGIASILPAVIISAIALLATGLLGKYIAPFFIHKVASANSRELLVLSAVALALGTAALTSALGISAALGAFLAGVVIAESQENQAVFAEIRPLRDLFVALFFVTLGFLVRPEVLLGNIGLILVLVALVLIIKFLVVFLISLAFGYHGKTAVAVSVGLAQVGEFSFIIFSLSKSLGLISSEMTSLGIAVTILTLIVTPILFKGIVPFWKKLKDFSGKSTTLGKAFSGWDRRGVADKEELTNHIVICGYGRVGSWVGKALRQVNMPFVVIDYNQKVVNLLKERGEAVIYGDPTEPEVLEAAAIRGAKAIVIAIPDRFAQEALVTHVQTIAPEVKIITRVHQDEDWEKLRALKVEKLVQPEFEAAMAIVRGLMSTSGKSKEEVSQLLKSLRLSHSRTV